MRYLASGVGCILLLLVSGCLLDGVREHYLRTSDGVKLAYQYHPERNEKGAVILVHGLGSTLSSWYYLEKEFHRQGWSTFSMDLRGHGFSTEWRDKEIVWTQFNDGLRKSSLKDIEAAVKKLGDSENIWLVGASFGANLALNYAAQDKRIRGVVLLSPGFMFGGMESQPALIAYGNRPALFAGARDDTMVANTCRVLYETASGPKELLIFDEGGHGTEMLETIPELKEDIIEWMTQQSAS